MTTATTSIVPRLPNLSRATPAISAPIELVPEASSVEMEPTRPCMLSGVVFTW